METSNRNKYLFSLAQKLAKQLPPFLSASEIAEDARDFLNVGFHDSWTIADMIIGMRN